MSEQMFRQLISGETRGCAAACARLALLVLTVPYRAIMAVRNAAYDHGWISVHRVNVPVVAIGNLTTGGTGKTPVVAMVVQALLDAGLRPGIVSRGYRADTSGTNDEKRVLDHLCPGVPHQQNSDRVATASQLVRSGSVDVVVLDDAFQHRRIHRDLNVVLIDATCPFGHGDLLPRGLLREPLRSLRRADVVLITRANLADETSLHRVEAAVQRHNANLCDRIFRVSFRPTALVTGSNQQHDLSGVTGRRVVVATAIGNPENFVATCEQLGAKVVASRFFPDHHHFSAADVAEVMQLAEANGCERVLVTMKDLVKLPPENAHIAAVQIQTAFHPPQDEAKFQRLVVSALAVTDTETQ